MQSKEYTELQVDNCKILVSNSSLFIINSHIWRICKKGYAFTYIAAGGKSRKIALHEMIMGRMWGTSKKDGLVVHHKNFNKLDNRIENLQLLTRAEHNKLHNLINKHTKKVQINKREGIRELRKRVKCLEKELNELKSKLLSDNFRTPTLYREKYHR